MYVVQQPKRFSNFNQPLLKVLERLVQKSLLRPLINVKPLSLNSPKYDPNSYCNFHQAIGHPTNTCIRHKHEIQDLIDSEKITELEKSNPNPNTKTNLFLNYLNVPPPAAIVTSSGISKEESPDAPKSDEKVEDLLGQPSSKFDYKVFYSKPPSYDIPFESIIPRGWGDEFKNDESLSEKNKRVENFE